MAPLKYKKRNKVKKRVNKNTAMIKKLSKQQFKRVQYYLELLTDGATKPVQIVKIMNPSLWKGIFASNVAGERQDRFFCERVITRVNLTVSSSGLTTVSPFHYHIFMVSLKKTYAKNTYFRTSEMSLLQDEIDYYQTNIGSSVGSAQWQLNPLLYNIHAQRKGMIGDFANEGLISAPGLSSASASQVNNIADANKNHVMPIKWKKLIKRGYGESVPGTLVDWKDMTANDINNTDQLYFIIFHSAYGTQELACHTGFTIHGKVPV